MIVELIDAVMTIEPFWSRSTHNLENRCLNWGTSPNQESQYILGDGT